MKEISLPWRVNSIFLIILLSLFLFFGKANSEVIGEFSYKNCLHECCKECLGKDSDWCSVYSWDHYCVESACCSECVDKCKQELEKNAPKVAKKIRDIEVVEHIPTGSCFVEGVSSWH